MTEKSEKAQRHALEKEHDVLKAAEIVAHRLENKTNKSTQENYFYED